MRKNLFGRNTKGIKAAAWLLAVVVVFVTTYSLILPAITIETETAENEPGISIESPIIEPDQPEIEEAAETGDTEDSEIEEESSKSEETKEPEEPEIEEEFTGPVESEKTEASETEEENAEPEESEETEDAETVKTESDIKAGITSIYDTDGASYRITVTYDDAANVPEGSELTVREILPEETGDGETSEYDEYAARTEEVLGWEDEVISYIRIFDIKIVDPNGEKVTIEVPVDVKIELNDNESAMEESEMTKVVHFADENGPGEIIGEVATEGETVSFEAEGFSAYAIVAGPEAIPTGWFKAEADDDLTIRGYYIGHIDGYYFRNTLTGDNTRKGITKTKPAKSYPPDTAALYYFEDAGDGKYYIYCYNGNEKQYVVNENNNSLIFGTDANKTAFSVNANANGWFTINNGQWYWNMQGGAGGTRFCSYNNANDNNNKLYFWYFATVESDPYKLNGKSYGLLNWNGGQVGKALMAQVSGNNLAAKSLTVMSNENNNDDKLFVPNDSDISMWTFHWIENDNYYLTAVADGSTKYLRISGDGLSLVSVPDDSCKIQCVPGTGVHENQICLRSVNATLSYSGNIDSGFTVGGTTGSEWLYFALESELTTEYNMPYSAKKKSVSDPNITTGSKIIVYTMIWNEETKQYEYYAIDHDGTLVPCTESGDYIEWVGGRVNTLLWQFTEYTEEDGTPNYYYELFNEYSGKYIAPQITDGQILSDDMIGINLDGRRNGRYYSSILAWDVPGYAFAGYKVENGRIVACPKNESLVFYFAEMEDVAVDDILHTVDTVKNSEHGITMKMIDVGARADLSGFLGNDDGGIGTVLHQGLLSTELGEDGYPVASKEGGTSLGSIFAGAQEVDHLFIESVYKASGYYEFDSAQNFASLKEDRDGDGVPDFLVYKELGTYDSVGSRNTLKHGQFFPYNDLEAGLFASVNKKNLYSTTGAQLPEGDPRKYEQLYLIKNIDCYFAAELEASFVQTPSGLDAWNHDIIYEFTGDDDFWLYVDGELVIDLGGIHSAVPGSVNFRTGQVNVNGTTHSLRDIFYNNYLGRGHTEAEALAYVDEKFEQNEDGQWVFRDNTTHTMRIFYMERGGGASNLYMRFNLASIKPGTVLLKKELSGVDESESVLAEFPYQIKYKKKDDPDPGTEYYLTNYDPANEDPGNYVFYKDSENPVSYKKQMTIAGVTYNDVFMLKPGEEAEITFPVSDNGGAVIESYSIVECCVDTTVYDRVSVNDEEIEGDFVSGAANREDYGIGYATTDDRARVAYDNHVDPEALRTLTITKLLYDESGIHSPEHELREDTAAFDFRLYLATEFSGSLNDSGANMHTYHVKDQDGNYCRWDVARQSFVSVGTDDYDSLTDAEKESVSFATSMNGAISKIPAFYTVEIRNILAGTQYRAEERPSEIPDGYSFQEYETDDSASEIPRNGVSGVVDTIMSGSDSHVDVCNLKGWGLRMNKVWTDEDYMTERDPAYFALFTRDEGNNLTPVSEPNTVRRLEYGEDSIYWYFLTLPVTGVDFDHYEIREVSLSEPEPDVDDEGYVTDYGVLTPVEEGETIGIGGVQKGESRTSEFEYTVSYKKGNIEDDSNVRADMVTNSRPGITIRKEDWSGNAIAGAIFTLEDDSGELIGEFTADEEGFVTVALLREDADYTLTETKTPQGYAGPGVPMMIRFDGADLMVDGPDSAYYCVTSDDKDAPVLTIRNRPYIFECIKQDGDTEEPLSGVHFALHREVTVDNVTMIDLNPMPGYEDLVTDVEGKIPGVDGTLPAGVYELREKSTAEGYLMLGGYIDFSVSGTGIVAMGAYPAGVSFDDTTESDGTRSYVLTVSNFKKKKVSFVKVDIGDTDSPLEGAVFDLYAVAEGDEGEEILPALYTGLTSDAEGVVKDGTGNSVFELDDGKYHLVETAAPAGFELKEGPVVIELVEGTPAPNGVIYDEGTSLSYDDGKSYDPEARVYTLRISNSSGVELPMAGGPGTWMFYVAGSLLVLIAAVWLAARSLAD